MASKSPTISMTIGSHKPAPTLAGSFVKPIFVAAALRSSSQDSTPISAPQVQGDSRVPLRAFEEWLDQTKALVGDSDLGLRALGHVDEDSCGVVGFGAATAATLGQALAFFAQNGALLNGAADWRVRLQRSTALLELRHHTPIPSCLRHYQVGLLLRTIGRWDGNASALSVSLACPRPGSGSLHGSIFSANRVRYDAPCDAIGMHVSHLERPMQTREPALHDLLASYARSLSPNAGLKPVLPWQVRGAIAEALPRGECNVVAVARKFGICERTLARYLAANRTSFSEQLDMVRRESAERYLETTDLALSRISRLLGYSGPSTFCRAFLRWTGRTALAHRKATREQRWIADEVAVQR